MQHHAQFLVNNIILLEFSNINPPLINSSSGISFKKIHINEKSQMFLTLTHKKCVKCSQTTISILTYEIYLKFKHSSWSALCAHVFTQELYVQRCRTRKKITIFSSLYYYQSIWSLSQSTTYAFFMQVATLYKYINNNKIHSELFVEELWFANTWKTHEILCH